MTPFDSLNRPKAHTIEIHFQAFLLKLLGVAFRWVILINKLTTTLSANMILFAAALPIFLDIRRATVWTMHSRRTQIIFLLCNAFFLEGFSEEREG